MTMYDALHQALSLPAVQHDLATTYRNEVHLLATLLELDPAIELLPFVQSSGDRALWTLLLVSQTVQRTGGMREYHELLRALAPAKPGWATDDHGVLEKVRDVKGWAVRWLRTRNIAEVTKAEQSGATICRWSIEGAWTWVDDRTGEKNAYRQCPGGAAETNRVSDGRLIVEWYGDDYDVPESTVELTSAGGWIELLTVHRTDDE